MYKTTIYDDHGNPLGKYVGRTSGQVGEKTSDILERRQRGHHRNVGDLDPIFSTDKYAAVRGAEQIEIEKLRKAGTDAGQINGVGEKNKRKEDYDDCAKSKGAG